jgi:hypothetical protein
MSGPSSDDGIVSSHPVSATAFSISSIFEFAQCAILLFSLAK